MQQILFLFVTFFSFLGVGAHILPLPKITYEEPFAQKKIVVIEIPTAGALSHMITSLPKEPLAGIVLDLRHFQSDLIAPNVKAHRSPLIEIFTMYPTICLYDQAKPQTFFDFLEPFKSCVFQVCVGEGSQDADYTISLSDQLLEATHRQKTYDSSFASKVFKKIDYVRTKKLLIQNSRSRLGQSTDFHAYIKHAKHAFSATSKKTYGRRDIILHECIEIVKDMLLLSL